MIRPLRAVHRGVFVALAVVLPTLIVAAVRGRHAPAVQELPDEYQPVVPTLWAGEDWLVYWVDEPAPLRGELPAGAEFVGTVRSGAFELQLPPGKAWVVYSLLEGRIVIDSESEDPE